MTSLYVWLKFVHLAGLGAFLFGHGIAGGASLALRARPAGDVSRALLERWRSDSIGRARSRRPGSGRSESWPCSS